jgi:uncharacterized protein YjbI with pentapeptide repeats
MSQIPLRNAAFQIDAFDCDLSQSRFEDSLLAGASFKYSSFEGAQFELVRMDGAQMKNVSFEGAQMERVSFVNCHVKHGRYAGFTIDGIPVDALLKSYHAENA